MSTMLPVSSIKFHLSPAHGTVANPFSLQYTSDRYSTTSLEALDSDVTARIQGVVQDAVILDDDVLFTAKDLAEFVFKTLRDGSPPPGFFPSNPTASPEGVLVVRLTLRTTTAPTASGHNEQRESAGQKRKRRPKTSSEEELGKLFLSKASMRGAGEGESLNGSG